MCTFDLDDRVQFCRVRPGDTLVVRVPTQMRQAPEFAPFLQAQLKANTPAGSHVFVIIGDGIIESLPEDAMRAQGWVRAPAEAG